MSETITDPRLIERAVPVTVGGSGDPRLAEPVLEFVDAINRGDLEAAVARLTPDAVHSGHIANYTPEGVRVMFGMVREAFPDVYLEVRECRVEGRSRGGTVISRIVATGTHSGVCLGKEPTGRVVAWESVDIAEIVDSAQDVVDTAETDHGKIVEFEKPGDADVTHAFRVFKRKWDLWRDSEMWKEIGFIPGIMC